MMSESAHREDSFPRALTALFVAISLAVVGGGFVLWWPQRGRGSTANSDLGLALIGGGLAITAGFVVARVVFIAERRFDAALRADQEVRNIAAKADQEARERQSLKQSLSLATRLSGADLHGAELDGVFLREKHMDAANLYRTQLRRADLSGSVLQRAAMVEAVLTESFLNGANLNGARSAGSRSPGRVSDPCVLAQC
jgi:hypothetical protein